MLGGRGRRTVSKIVPSFVHNTVDNPIFPNTGQRLTLSSDLAVLGGNTQYLKPRVEGIRFWRHTTRTSFGVRGLFEYIAPVGETETLPLFEKLFLGGEYSIRGFDIRSIGPQDPLAPGLVLGGNKSLLFNVEYMFSIVQQVRLIAFYDAGQVVDERQKFAMDQFRTSTGAEVRFFMPVLNVPFRLIFAANPQREGVFDNNFRPAKNFTFRFAVGSTF
jgi:outer membrane protein insertion porin family